MSAGPAGEAAARAPGARGDARGRRRRRSRVDVRVIAATHRNLEEMVADGAFREDLYYRLEVVPIEVPPLQRAARVTSPMLAEHFRREINCAGGPLGARFSPEVMEKLCAHDWPGNVRELENLVERMVIVAGPPRGRAARSADRHAFRPRWISSRAASTCRCRGGPAHLAHPAGGSADRSGARANGRQQEPRRRAAGDEPHHAGREAATEECRLTREASHLSDRRRHRRSSRDRDDRFQSPSESPIRHSVDGAGSDRSPFG